MWICWNVYYFPCSLKPFKIAIHNSMQYRGIIKCQESSTRVGILIWKIYRNITSLKKFIPSTVLTHIKCSTRPSIRPSTTCVRPLPKPWARTVYADQSPSRSHSVLLKIQYWGPGNVMQNIGKHYPSKARQNTLATAGTNITKPHARHLRPLSTRLISKTGTGARFLFLH